MLKYSEHDEFSIPEKYLKMSTEELHKEKERMFAAITPTPSKTKDVVVATKNRTVTFYF